MLHICVCQHFRSLLDTYYAYRGTSFLGTPATGYASVQNNFFAIITVIDTCLEIDTYITTIVMTRDFDVTRDFDMTSDFDMTRRP